MLEATILLGHRRAIGRKIHDSEVNEVLSITRLTLMTRIASNLGVARIIQGSPVDSLVSSFGLYVD